MTPFLLSLDFDGTSFEERGSPHVAKELHLELEAWRREGGLWVVNTGRSLAHTAEGLVKGRFAMSPSFLVTRERDLHVKNPVGRWVPLGDWNVRAEEAHDRLFRRARGFLKEVRRFIKHQTLASFLSLPEEPAGIVASNEEEMDRICAFIDPRLGEVENLSHERNSIYLRFSHAGYHKGSALAHLAAELGVPRDRIFAAGDNYNDQSMLVPEVAGHLACPANSVPEVIAQVREGGGFVAPERASLGTAMALARVRGGY